jgi:carbon monoxide dehydrogenase subunit G
MDFDNSFTVAAPIDEVWKAMLDLERVAPCVPGARVVDKTADNSYKVAIKVKVGPVSMTYNGTVEIVETDDAAHKAVMRARAKESRGQGTANATVEMTLAEQGGQTEGSIHSDVAISGRVASMGRSVMADVSANLIDTFSKNLAAMLSGEEPAAATDGAAATPAQPAKIEAEPAPTSGGAPFKPSVGSDAPPPRPAPSSPPEGNDSLDIGSVAGTLMAGRLQDPKVLGGALAGAAVLGFLIGRRSAH